MRVSEDVSRVSGICVSVWDKSGEIWECLGISEGVRGVLVVIRGAEGGV